MAMGADPAVAYEAFAFTVEMRGRPVAGFSEVSGLAEESGALTWRELGEQVLNAVRKLVGLRKYTNITLERGYTEDSALWDWLREVRGGAAGATRDLVIVRHDERRRPVRTWRITKARCRRLVGPLDAKGGSMAIEKMQLTCEDVDPPV